MNEITNLEGFIVVLCTTITFALGFWYGYDVAVHNMEARFYQDKYDKDCSQQRRLLL